jgi:hypothetical protein
MSFFFLSFLYGQIIFLEWDIYRDNHIARVSSFEVAESILHLINYCLLFRFFRFFPFVPVSTTNKVCISTNSCVICYCLYIILLCVHTCLQVWSMKKESEIFVQFNPYFLLPDSFNLFLYASLYRSLSRCRVK